MPQLMIVAVMTRDTGYRMDYNGIIAIEKQKSPSFDRASVNGESKLPGLCAFV